MAERDGFEPEISLAVLPSTQSVTLVPPSWDFDFDAGDARKRLSKRSQSRRAIAASLSKPWGRVRWVVPATSFCEYADTKPRKTPIWFALSEKRPPFAFAGLWATVGPQERASRRRAHDFVQPSANPSVARAQAGLQRQLRPSSLARLELRLSCVRLSRCAISVTDGLRSRSRMSAHNGWDWRPSRRRAASG